MKILIVKSSAFGDIIHAFPCLAFLRERFPEAQIDWVVERRCAELVHRQPLVDRVIEMDSRKWRKNPWKARGEFRAFVRELRATRYDVLFDLQGNSKSGLVTLLARAKDKVGHGRKTVPEWPNLFATTKRFDPPPKQNVRDDLLYLVQSYTGGNGQPSLPTPLTVSDG